jgi:hypothetical protein
VAESALLPVGAVRAPLPELGSVYWRPRASESRLTHTARLWTLTTVAHTAPLLIAAVALVLLAPMTTPVAVILVIHAWMIPELYAARGAGVLRRRTKAAGQAESVALGFLGDLLGHDARAVHARTGLVVERGRLGVWLIGEAGAVLVRRGARRVHCYCVQATDRELPRSDRIAHLLLALRADECGFATVANLAFSGARWRLARRLDAPARAGLLESARLARRATG